jgi:hypothetical protein
MASFSLARSSGVHSRRSGRSLRKGPSKFLDALHHASSSGVDYYVLTFPRFVFTRDNFFPAWQAESTNVYRSCFHTLTMELRVRADHLNFNGACMSPMGNVDPGIATQLNWIHRIRDHSSTQAKVVLRDRIGDTISLVVYRLAHHCGIAKGLLNGIDAQIGRTELPRQVSGNRCFSGSR